MGHSRHPFLYFRLFKTDVIQLIVNKICQWPDLNRGSLVLEASAMPTVPQQCPLASVTRWLDCLFIFLVIYNNENLPKSRKNCQSHHKSLPNAK